MASVTFKGEPVETIGNFPQAGQSAPDFTVVKSDLSELSLSELKGKKVVLNIFPSVDTSVCAMQLKKFNTLAANIDNTVLLFVSLDLPFAFARFCGAEGIDNAITTSDYRYKSLGEKYGVQMQSGALKGLYARASIVLNEAHEVIYSELVAEVTNEPNYDAAMSALQA